MGIIQQSICRHDFVRVWPLDYRLFCMALAQCYVPSSGADDDDVAGIFRRFYDRRGPRNFQTLWREMSTDEKKQIQRSMDRMHERAFVNMKAMPRQLILVFR